MVISFLGKLPFKEYPQVACPGRVIQLTESAFPVSGSAALTHLSALLLHTLPQAGHVFILDDSNGVINRLAQLLQQQGLTNIQTWLHTLEYRTGTAEEQSFYEDVQHMFRTLLPFFHKRNRVPDDYEETYQQTLSNILQPD